MPLPRRSGAQLVPVALVLGATALVAVAIACSGKVVDDGQSGAPGAGTPGAADAASGKGGAPNNPACPANAPAEGGACSADGLVCEYGADFNPTCNTLVACVGTRWSSAPFYSDHSGCPTPPAPVPNPASCAATRAAVPEGQACGADSPAAPCAYGASSCACGVACLVAPLRQPPCAPDAGSTTDCCDTSKVVWSCFDGPPLCASPRPRVGSACTDEGARCAVVQPARSCGQPVLTCQSGVWALPSSGCPL